MIILIVVECVVTIIAYLCVSYAEGYPGARYYGGNENIDKVESLCQQRALEAFNLDPSLWGVNVQSLSGTPANFQVYSALLQPHDRIMGLDLPHGGHLSHGYQTDSKKISATSVYFETFPYRLDSRTGQIDYDMLAQNAKLYRPKLIVAGVSAYSRLLDYKRFREICDENNSILMADMAHIAGLVVAGEVPAPFEYADVVTTTTHKSLRGPRGALIFYRKGEKQWGKRKAKAPPTQYDLESKINFSVFPSLQGGPHNHTIASIATALKQASAPEFKEYQKQVLANAKAFASRLMSHGYNLVSGGTDNHLVLLNLKESSGAQGLDGARVERILDICNIATNKNTVPTDVSAMVPFGIRMGAPSLTTRGFTESDFEAVADFFHRAVGITAAIRDDVVASTGSTKLKDFRAHVADNEAVLAKYPALQQLKVDVNAFAEEFPVIGY